MSENPVFIDEMKTIWFNGLSGSGKTTIAKRLVDYYKKQDVKIILLDADEVRSGLNSDLGFFLEDRQENLRRVAEVAKILNQNDIMVVTAFITPTNEIRENIKEIIPNVIFIHLCTELQVCEERDVKGLYAKARAGLIKDFTGIDSPFESMPHAWLNIDTGIKFETVDDIVARITNRL